MFIGKKFGWCVDLAFVTWSSWFTPFKQIYVLCDLSPTVVSCDLTLQKKFIQLFLTWLWQGRTDYLARKLKQSGISGPNTSQLDMILKENKIPTQRKVKEKE